MASTTYRYELRRGDTITATGHITYDDPLEAGDEITIGRSIGIVRELGPRNPDGEIRLVIEFPPHHSADNDAALPITREAKSAGSSRQGQSA